MKWAIGAATLVSTLVVLARVFARWRMMKSFGIDDGLICVAQVKSFHSGGQAAASELETLNRQYGRPTDIFSQSTQALSIVIACSI